jgi:hypothetical protein
MRGKQCRCKSFNAKSSLSLRQLRLVPKVGQRGQLKLQQGIRKNNFTKLTIRYKSIKQLSMQVRMQRITKRYNNIQLLTNKETSNQALTRSNLKQQ